MVNGNTAAYEYDLAGNISAVTDAEGRRVNFAYDQNGNLTQITYPDGTTETTQYDLLGRVVQVAPRTGLATAYTYDQLGNVTSVTQGEQITRYEYDLLGRLTKVITPDGAETTYAYDALGNLVGETDPLGNQTRFVYTAESLLEQVTYANGATQSLTYDLAGNVISETDGEGNTKRYQYDRVNRLTTVIDEAGNKTSYGYDALDNITKVTDALKHVTRYTYDKNGNLLTETDALGNTVEYAYTPEGWLSAITKADGTVLTFAYDKTGNLLTQNTGENQNIESSYNEIGQVTTVTSPEGTITYQYNQQGYLVSVTNGNGDVVSYTYDQYGNKLSMTYPDGRVVSYTYDSMNRMTSVTGLDGEVTTYAYDAAGRRVETASRNLTTEYKYDVVGSLVEQTTTGSSNLSFQYSYNLNGYITGEVRTENGETVTSAYAYDPLGELISFTQSTGYGEQYTYDKVGNMTQKVITPLGSVPNEKEIVENAVTLKMKYNQGNQLVSMANGGSKITYKYDKNGSMVEKALTSKQYGTLTDTYAYNNLDQLVSYAGYDGYQQQFTYDANGMRLSKSEYGNSNRSTLEELLRGEIAGLPEIVAQVATSEDETAVPAEYEWATTEYLYDITQEYYQVIQQTTTSGNTTATTAYAYGLERIAAYDANNTTQYIYDGRGSVAQTISAPVAGASVSAALPEVQVQSYVYTAFGEQMGGKVSGFAYNAEDFDAATGMINLRMRQYEPTLNRFSQKDAEYGAMTFSISFNRYVYVQNNPIIYSDPSGTWLKKIKNGIQNIWNYASEHIIKPLCTTYVASEMAQTIAKTDEERKQELLADQWLEYCRANSKNLLGIIKKGYENVEEKLEFERVGSVYYYDTIVFGCIFISDEVSYTKNKPYYEGYVESYGFDDTMVRLLNRVRSQLLTLYPYDAGARVDYYYTNVIGRLVYGTSDEILNRFRWDGTAGNPFLVTPTEELFVDMLGLSRDEYKYLVYNIQLQNKLATSKTGNEMTLRDIANPVYLKRKNEMETAYGRKLTDKEFVDEWNRYARQYDNSPDFAHMNITTASILSTDYGKNNFLHIIADFITDGRREEMAGWLGDATLTGGEGHTSFGKDDYVADLDAVNITNIMKEHNVSLVEATTMYQQEIQSGETRATIFLRNTPLEEVEKLIYLSLNKDKKEDDIIETLEGLREKQPDTYNFIMNLREGNHEMRDYVSEENDE